MQHFPFEGFMPFAMIIGIIGTIGWIYLERMKIKHGYPLTGSWGQALKPNKMDDETVERLNSLTAENAALRGQLKNLQARMQVLEKIATDPAARLADEIERLN
jgi:hypothetical protein